MENLKELRIKAKFTQLEAANYFGVSLRNYRDYENDTKKQNSIKYKYFIDSFNKILFIDEKNGLLTIDYIKEQCTNVFNEYKVNYCYLFGSYAKGTPKADSDVDLLIDADVTGLNYFGLIEKLRVSLKKVVDLLDIKQLSNNPELIREILKDGIKIYG